MIRSFIRYSSSKNLSKSRRLSWLPLLSPTAWPRMILPTATARPSRPSERSMSPSSALETCSKRQRHTSAAPSERRLTRRTTRLKQCVSLCCARFSPCGLVGNADTRSLLLAQTSPEWEDSTDFTLAGDHTLVVSLFEHHTFGRSKLVGSSEVEVCSFFVPPRLFGLVQLASFTLGMPDLQRGLARNSSSRRRSPRAFLYFAHLFP